MFLDKIDPSHYIIIAFSVGDIVYEKDGIWISKVTGDEAFESFLSCGIPEL